MDRRVEVAFPMLDPALRQEVLDFLELQWQDNVKSRLIDKRQSNPYCAKEPGDKDVQAQPAFHARLARQGRKRNCC